METTITQKFGEPSASSIQQETALRARVEIQLPDGRVFSGPRGATLEDFFRSIAGADKPLVVGAIVNHDLRELTQPVLLDEVWPHLRPLLGKPAARHHVLQHELGHSRSADVAVTDEKDANGRLGHGEILYKETDCLKDTAHIISQQPPSP